MVSVCGLKIPFGIVLTLVYLTWVLALLVAKGIVFRIIRRIVSHTKTQLDDLFLSAADLPLTLWILASGAPLIQAFLPTNVGVAAYFVNGFKAVTIISIVIFVDRSLAGVIRFYGARIDFFKTSGGIVQGFVRLAVLAMGLLVLLDSFGVSITPIIASLGIGSLAIALALQPTLENLFAGIQIVADKPLQVGQFVKLESGEEGYVHKIGWRSTWIRMLPNNMVVIPNKTLVNSKLVNYYYPEKELAVTVEVGVHYGSDLEKVERVAVEVAKETLQALPCGIKDFEPAVRYHTFADSSINFTVVLRAHEVVDSYLIKHEFIKRLHRRFTQESIVIPYPIRAVNYDQEKAFAAAQGQA